MLFEVCVAKKKGFHLDSLPRVKVKVLDVRHLPFVIRIVSLVQECYYHAKYRSFFNLLSFWWKRVMCLNFHIFMNSILVNCFLTVSIFF